MPCSTPIAGTAAAVKSATRNSPGLSRRMSLRPFTSTMPAAMVKTMLARTQRGRYCNGPVRNISTTSTHAASSLAGSANASSADANSADEKVAPRGGSDAKSMRLADSREILGITVGFLPGNEIGQV